MSQIIRHLGCRVSVGLGSITGGPERHPGGNTKLERLTIPGPADSLEGLLEWEPAATARRTALVCHPHPLYGGTMHTKVVFRAAKSAVLAGLPALRFNFRGVGKSGSSYAQGAGEREDVRAALDYLETRFPAAPVCLMGFSFGSWVGLSVGSEDPRVRELVGLGLPVGSSDFGFLDRVRKPKLIVQGTRDQYGPRQKVETLFHTLAEPKWIHWVEDADHFFSGKLDEVQEVLSRFLTRSDVAGSS